MLTIESGDTVVLETREVTDDQITPHSPAETLVALDEDRLYPLTGPIRIEGAAPGDTLAVDILELWPGVGAGRGSFPVRACSRTISSSPISSSSTSVKARPPSARASSYPSPRSWGRWGSARTGRTGNPSCRPGSSAETSIPGSSPRRPPSTCLFRSMERSSAAEMRTQRRATARSASRRSRRRCGRRCASRSRRAIDLRSPVRDESPRSGGRELPLRDDRDWT